MQEMMRGSLGDGAAHFCGSESRFETEVEGQRRWDVRHAVDARSYQYLSGEGIINREYGCVGGSPS